MRKISYYYYNETTQQETPVTNNTENEHYNYHKIAVKWYNDGANVAIVNGETGEIVLIWKH